MNIWKANVASEANYENLLRKVAGKIGAAELVEAIESRLGKRGKLYTQGKMYNTKCESIE